VLGEFRWGESRWARFACVVVVVVVAVMMMGKRMMMCICVCAHDACSRVFVLVLYVQRARTMGARCHEDSH